VRWETTRSSSRSASGFREQRDALLADEALQGVEFGRAYAALVDSWLAELLGDEPGVALVAVGGYGRADLCPGSDVDVLLVHARRHEREAAGAAERVWYPLWDAGLKVGHATRTVKQALALADRDLDTATSLLDVRWLAGDRALAEELATRARQQWQRRASRELDQLARSVRERHVRAGEVAFLLEPDLKEGRGGLRDVHALGWAEMARRILLEGDDEALERARATLVAVRVELHRRTRRANNRLLLQEQDGIAAALRYADADALMAAVAEAARVVAWTSDEAWRRIESALRGPTGRMVHRDHPLAPGVVQREGEVTLAPGVDPRHDRVLLLRVAAAAAQAAAPIARGTLERLAAEAPGPGGKDGTERWPDDARHALLTLLGAGVDAIPVFESLDHLRLLSRVLPEWEAVRCRPQRNAYHRFTVDRHLCEAAAGAAALARRVARPDLLLVGTWLHDIGKGSPGDHTDAGVVLMARIAPRLGFPPADVEVLVALVRHHLLLADAATRRDVADAATIGAVARAVGDRETLEVLAALTEADSRATGDTAWSPWKERLVVELVWRVGAQLEGRRPEPSRFPTPEHRRLLADADGRLLVHVDGGTVTVVAPDRPGLFCRVAGTLALHGLDVLAADAWSSEERTAVEEGMALEELHVEHAFGRAVDWDRFKADLARALEGRLDLAGGLAERARSYVTRTRQAATPARPRVIVDREASDRATVVEVRAPDGIGVLYRITRAIADLGLDVRTARVATLGHEVVDSFYLCDAAGAPVTDDELLRRLELAVLDSLEA
jgi:[protein-PII] uridylyltransferase